MAMKTMIQRPADARVFHEDCLSGLPMQVKSGTADLLVTDPPYNIGQDYDSYFDSMAQYEYLEYMRVRIAKAYDALKPEGTFWIAINDDNAAEIKLMCQKMGFHLRRWIVWHFTFGQNQAKNFTLSKVHWFYFTKHKKRFTFNADDPALRVPSSRLTEYNDKRANPKGRLPNDVWILRPQDLGDEGFSLEKDCWYFSRVCGTFKTKEKGLPNQLPIAMIDRIIRACSNPGDLVVDMFNGTGTCAEAAVLLGRRYVGFDVSKRCVQVTERRIKQAQAPASVGRYREVNAARLLGVAATLAAQKKKPKRKEAKQR